MHDITVTYVHYLQLRVGVIIGFVTNAGMSDAIGSFPSTANEAATAMRDFLDGMNEVQCTGAVIYIQPEYSCILTYMLYI